MNFINEQYGIRIVLECFQNAFETLFEITPIFGAGEECTHVQRVDQGFGQNIRHVLVDNAARQTFGNGGFANAGFADQQRVVLASAAEDLDHAFQFAVTANQRVDLSLLGKDVQVDRVLFQRAALCFLSALSIAILALALGTITRYFGNPV